MHFRSICRLKRQISPKSYLATLASSVFPTHALLFTLVILLSISIVMVAIGQSPAKASSPSEPIIKVFLPRAIEALENGNSGNALEYLHAIDQELSSFPDQNMSVTWIYTVQLLVRDAIEEVRNGNGSNALTYLSLASERVGVPLPTSGDQGLAEKKAETDSFLNYDNPTLDLKIQYPSNWSVVEYPYNPSGNNTIVGFFSDEKTSSELGNLSGVSGSFVPYLDIFSFDSKNMSLDTIFNGIVHNFRNNSNFSVNQSGSFALSGNQSANMIVYDARVGGDELFRKIQAYTLYNNRVYVISFTSQQSLFENYLPIVQKMISSFLAR